MSYHHIQENRNKRKKKKKNILHQKLKTLWQRFSENHSSGLLRTVWLHKHSTYKKRSTFHIDKTIDKEEKHKSIPRERKAHQKINLSTCHLLENELNPCITSNTGYKKKKTTIIKKKDSVVDSFVYRFMLKTSMKFIRAKIKWIS